MAQVNLRFPFAAFYDAQRVDVVVGTEWDAQLVQHEGDVEWIDHNDPILEVVPNGHDAHMVAKQIGKGRITIAVKQADDTTDKVDVVKVVRFNVVSEIQLPASNLGLTVEKIPKEEQN